MSTCDLTDVIGYQLKPNFLIENNVSTTFYALSVSRNLFSKTEMLNLVHALNIGYETVDNSRFKLFFVVNAGWTAYGREMKGPWLSGKCPHFSARGPSTPFSGPCLDFPALFYAVLLSGGKTEITF